MLPVSRQPSVNSFYLYNASNVEELKENFLTQKTKSIKWRESQLKAMIKGCKELEKEFGEAVRADLGLCPEMGLFGLLFVIAACEHDLKHLKEYMKDRHTETELLLGPGDTLIRYEPLGVVAVFSPWNYPINLALKPVVQAISAGNCVILKPSEMSPNVSRVT